MTYEEHMARAMLLGRVYDWRDHTYCILGGVGPIINSSITGLDADTLDVVDVSESTTRLARRGTIRKDWREPPND